MIPRFHTHCRFSQASIKSNNSQKSATNSARRTSTDSAALVDVTDNRALTEAVTDKSDSSSDAGSDNSEFTGGKRMDALLKALNHEHESGLFFRTHIEVTKNKASGNTKTFVIEF